MTNKEDTVLKRFNEGLASLKSINGIGEYEIVTPYKMFDNYDENGLKEGVDDSAEGVALCLGKCVERLVLCDAIFSCKGWEKSKGCQLERATARIYGLEMLSEE